MSERGRVSKSILAFRLAAVGILTALLAIQIGCSLWSLVMGSRVMSLSLQLTSGWGAVWERDPILHDGGMRHQSEVKPDSPFGRLGLRKGDLVVAVNGVRLTDDPAAYFRAILHGSEGDPIELTWVRDGVEQSGTLRLSEVKTESWAAFQWRSLSLVKGKWPNTPVSGFMRAFFPFGPWAVLSLLLLLVGAPIGLLRPRDGAAFRVSLLLLSLGMVTCLQEVLVILWPLWLYSLCLEASTIGELLVIALAPRVLADFPNRSRLGGWFLRWRGIFYAGVGIPYAIDVLETLQGIHKWENWFWRLFYSMGEAIDSQAWVPLVFILWALGMPALLLLSQRRATRGRPEVRLRIVEAGFMVFPVLLLWVLVPPTVLLWQLMRPEGAFLRSLLFGVHVLVPVLLIACLPLSLAYAVFTRRAFGIRFIFRRGLQHLFLSRGVRVIEGLLLFLLVLEAIRQGQSRIGTSVPAVAGIAAGTTLFAMGVLARVNRPLMRRIDRRFFRESYDARRILISLGEGMTRLREQEEIFRQAGSAIQDALHPARIAFYFRGPNPGGFDCVWSRAAGGRAAEARGEDEMGTAWGGDRLEESALAGVRALEEGRPWVDLVPAVSAEVAAARRTAAIPFELLVTIRSSSGLAGCIGFAAKLSEEPYSGEDKELLATVAAQMGLALENAELLEVAKREAEQTRDLAIAREVQQNLFPKELPLAEGWDFAALCRPARAVGGDYYDLFAIDSDHVALAIGDVSGKGLGPSMLMSSAHTMIRSRLRQKGTILVELVGELNEHLYASTSPEMFLTLFVGVLDVRSGRLRYVNGGHNPPLLLHGSREKPVVLEAGGTVVGIVPGIAFAEGEARVEPDDLLALYSDGVTEATNEKEEMFGEERLAAELAAAFALTASGVLASLLDSVDRFAGGCEQADDISLMLVRRGPR
ncbi:MAG: SpoIIE family protein phosphatase [Candidatus Eisenbacteria bacterium]